MDDNGLPVELKQQIIENLSIRDRANLAKASRALYLATESYLYETINLTAADMGLALLRAIQQRPRMVSRTETLKMIEPEADENNVITSLLAKLPKLRSFHLRTNRLNRADEISLDLSSFKMVELHIPACYLVGCLSPTPLLPSTLRYLHIKADNWISKGQSNLSSLLVQYIESKCVKGIDTQGVKFISIEPNPVFWLTARNELNAICKERGVELKLRPVEVPDRDPW